MGFLKKFGQIVLGIGKGIAIAEGIIPSVTPIVNALAPGAAGTVNTAVNDLHLIAGIIQNVEVFGQALALPGAQKLQAASPLVAQIILSSDLLAKHKIHDDAQFKKGVDAITSGVADILSSLEDKVETTDKT